MRPGFESFGRFLSLTAETEHQSCVLLTSREEPALLVPLEGSQASVRSLRLAPLDTGSCDKLLSEKELIGSAPDRMRLIEAYAGNPLALKIVAHTIVDLFDGEIAPFLEQGEVIFGGVRNLLEEQFHRLSSLEQSLLLWLTVLREPATIDELLEVWAAPVSRARLLEALDALYRRSLIERGFKPHGFALQSLVMEYLTAWLITQATAEDPGGKTRAPDRAGPRTGSSAGRCPADPGAFDCCPDFDSPAKRLLPVNLAGGVSAGATSRTCLLGG